MGIENEQKFLVTFSEQYRIQQLINSAKRVLEIEQIYLNDDIDDLERLRRVEDRMTGETKYYKTIKGRKTNGQGSEKEWLLGSRGEAEFNSCYNAHPKIHKLRYEVPYGKYLLEIDLFKEPLLGLMIVEIELNKDETLPNHISFGKNITEDFRFSNHALAKLTEDEFRELMKSI